MKNQDPGERDRQGDTDTDKQNEDVLGAGAGQMYARPRLMYGTWPISDRGKLFSLTVIAPVRWL